MSQFPIRTCKSCQSKTTSTIAHEVAGYWTADAQKGGAR